jgi:hypothetical protein
MRRQHGSWTAITPRTADRVILVLSLTHCEVSIDDTNRIVVTKFSDGKECLATRQDSDENRREAEDEGYEPTADGVWQCLVTHEVCHSLVSEWLWQKPSPTLRHVAGGERCEYGKQLYEEALRQRDLQATARSRGDTGSTCTACRSGAAHTGAPAESGGRHTADRATGERVHGCPTEVRTT